jgi:PAS domain S-box-containing protein
MYKYDEIDFKKICDNMPFSIYITDDKEKTLYVNSAYLNCSGLEAEQLVGKTIERIQDENLFQCEINRLVKKNKQISNAIAYIPSTDRRLHVTGVPVFDESGNIRYILTTDRTVEELAEIESQLFRLRMESVLNQQDLEYYRSRDIDDEICYVSNVMDKLMALVRTVAATDVTVLVTGESGTGKELLSNAVYKHSKRAKGPYVKINCAAIPSELMESELFGYEEGAFTGAKKGGKMGAFEAANGGTLLLDEIGEIPFQIQAKLLRVLQEGEIIRVGGREPIHLDTRIIAATNKNLFQEVKNGKFREDLYYRLNIMPLYLPPLRERKEDIPLLVSEFLKNFSKKYQRAVSLESGAMQYLTAYDWPGNVRELRNLMERLVIINKSGTISKSIIHDNLGHHNMEEEGKTLKDIVVQTEKRVIRQALGEYGSKRKAAAALGIDHSTLVKKCKHYQID